MLNDCKNTHIFISGLKTTAQESISEVPAKLNADEKRSEKISHGHDEAHWKGKQWMCLLC